MVQDPRLPEKLSWETFSTGLWKENPVFVMLLGLCPVLAVTNTAMNSLAMGLATTFVLLCSGVLVSLLRKVIPKQVRIASYIIIIATFVTITDYAIQAISLDLFGLELFGPAFQPWVVFVLPPGGFFVLAFWLFIFSVFRKRKERAQSDKEEVANAA
jgi:Na+-translocating ferredoxin:NAD+ oxidoreductase RnfE subunit